MEMCRMCAIALTRTASMVDATLPLHFLASSRLSSKQIDSRTRKASLTHNPRCISRHLHGYQRPPPSRPLEQPSRPLSHQIQLQRQQQPSSRPKSFKELVEMQKQQREMDGGSKGRLSDPSIDDRSLENSSSSAESPVSDSPHTRRIPSLPARMANSWRKMRQSGHEIDAKIETTLKEEMPGYSLAVVRAFTRRNKMYEDYHPVMQASMKQMFFHGHPFRGSIMLVSITPMLIFDLLRHVWGPFSFLAVILYMGSYWQFFMCKLTRSVWFNPEKNMYLIHLPYHSLRHPIAFKAGNVTEIDDLFANLSIRGGIKAYCHKDMFLREEDYYRMFKRERVVGDSERSSSPKKRK